MIQAVVTTPTSDDLYFVDGKTWIAVFRPSSISQLLWMNCCYDFAVSFAIPTSFSPGNRTLTLSAKICLSRRWTGTSPLGASGMTFSRPYKLSGTNSHQGTIFVQSSRKHIYSRPFQVSGTATTDDCCYRDIANVSGTIPSSSR